MISWSTINWTSQGFPLPLTTQRHNPSFKDYCPPQALRNLVPDPNGLSWLSDNDIWVEQWPIIKPKLTALKELVNEQLGLGHLEPSTNGHNTPIFVIYKRSIHYWSVNEQMEKKWAPHSLACSIPVPSPFSPYLYLTYQGLFFQIPLAPANKWHFAFTS